MMFSRLVELSCWTMHATLKLIFYPVEKYLRVQHY